MIRIDEIYENTFWPWLNQNKPSTRMFFCDPFGHTDREHLFNIGSTTTSDKDYIYFHDQEPVWMDTHRPLFNAVIWRNFDMKPRPPGHVVVSERGKFVEDLCNEYGWKSHYYFFHGWACLDWFRGYDKTFLIPRANQRKPTKTFMSPNRIVGGQRDHRVLFLYNVFINNMGHNHISAPKICPSQSVAIDIIAQKHVKIYPDIIDVFQHADLPKTFKGESNQKMISFSLSNFEEAQDSLIYVPTETVFFDRRTHITEKTFKAIALEMPFILLAPAGSLEYLREYGFKTFSPILDETYDLETNDIKRIEMVADQLKQIDALSIKEKQQIHKACLPIVEHNYHHFYHGGFCSILWTELTNMLKGIHV